MAVIESARALLVDPADRVLLIKLDMGLAFGSTSGTQRAIWLTPGGSLHRGESHEDALLREIREETGLSLAHPGHWVWTSPKRVIRNGVPVDTQARVYIQRVPHFVATPIALTPEERDVFCELRWWSIDEIAESSETFIPRSLAALLSPLLSGPWPEEPLLIEP